MTIYLQCDQFQGNVTTQNYNNAIKLLSVKHGLQRGIEQKVGTVENRGVGIPRLSHLTITKLRDSATVNILEAFYHCNNIPYIKLSHCSAGTPPKCFATDTYENLIISNFQEVAMNGKILEQIDFAFTKHVKGYMRLATDGTMTSPSYAGFDLQTGDMV